MLSIRTIAAEDLGYHLAYGDAFWTSGRIVDHSGEVFLLPPPDTLPADRPAPGPACWYDDEGRYRFPNANWLTQVVLSAVHRTGGIPALCWLRSFLVAGTFLLVALSASRLGAGRTGSAAAVLLAAAVAEPRFLLRPELLGGVVLAGQLFLLAGIDAGGLRARGACGLILLQLLFVNLHGYFPLGIALTAAVLGGEVLQQLRGGWFAVPPLRPLVLALGGQIAVCFANPWGWRLAALPVQTARFLAQNDVHAAASRHPWAHLADMRRTLLLPEGWAGDPTAWALLVLVASLVAAVLSLGLRGRFRWVPLLAGMAWVAWSAERNLAVGAMIIAPVSLAALRRDLALAVRRLPAPTPALPAVLVALAALALSWAAASSRLYAEQRVFHRFGVGSCRMIVPLDVTAHLSEEGVRQRIWSPMAFSSTVFGFTQPRPEMNLITNTWAYPPEALRMAADVTSTADPSRLHAALDQHDVDILLLPEHPMLGAILRQARWTPSFARNGLVVLVRAGSSRAPPPGTSPAPDEDEVRAWVESLRDGDPYPAESLVREGALAAGLGWITAATALLQAAVQADPERPDAWFYLGLQRRSRAQARRAAGDAAYREDYREAREMLERSRDLRVTPAVLQALGAIDAELAGSP